MSQAPVPELMPLLLFGGQAAPGYALKPLANGGPLGRPAGGGPGPSAPVLRRFDPAAVLPAV